VNRPNYYVEVVETIKVCGVLLQLTLYWCTVSGFYPYTCTCMVGSLRPWKKGEFYWG